MQSAVEIATAVRNGTFSPVDVVMQALARIDAVEDQIHAWVEIDREGALRQANTLTDAIRRGEDPGPLAGVPVGIKDIVDVADLPTRLGAPSFAHYTPNLDATTVARLRDAGAIIMGKTHTTEFAYLDPAPTRNPWQRDHTPGGSSSGSAAAVGAHTLPLAIGSQTVGSVLRPAAYCGCVGLKPTYGLISYTGTAALAASFDHLGVMASSVADAALALGALVGFDRFDPASLEPPDDSDYLAAIANPPAPRLGLVRSYYHGHATEEIEQHLDAVADQLRSRGATIVDAEMPADAAAIRKAGEPIMQYEAAQAHAALYAANKAQYRPSIKGLVEAGLSLSENEYQTARAVMRTLRDGMIATLQGFDALLMPVAPATAPAGIESTGNGIFCAPASFAGLPAISLPSGLASDGMPLAIQLMGAPLTEGQLLNTAAWIEGVLNFTAKPDIAP
jgi:Asp-tRNA(Asn)/Glu-tRNA(Gln) amidotransferase A subunit family amidase